MRKFILLVLAFSFFQFASAQVPLFPNDNDTVYTKATQMPYFIGCEAFDDNTPAKRNCSNRELVNFISRYLVYPEKAREEGIEGTVYVSFIIEKNGLLGELSLLNDIGGDCGKAAILVLEEMPRWQPGQQNGQIVRVRMNLPIQFKFRAEDSSRSEKYNLSWGMLHSREATKAELLKNIDNQLYVRGPEGSNRYIDEIEFIYEKDNRIHSATSRGDMSPDLEKIVEKVKHGGTLTIHASVQDRGQFLTISRSFAIVK